MSPTHGSQVLAGGAMLEWMAGSPKDACYV